jgi:hypothetical protein
MPMREPLPRADVWFLPPVPSWRRHGQKLIGRIGATVVEVIELRAMPQDTVHALASLWADVLLADLERRPPLLDNGDCAIA